MLIYTIFIFFCLLIMV